MCFSCKLLGGQAAGAMTEGRDTGTRRNEQSERQDDGRPEQMIDRPVNHLLGRRPEPHVGVYRRLRYAPTGLRSAIICNRSGLACLKARAR